MRRASFIRDEVEGLETGLAVLSMKIPRYVENKYIENPEECLKEYVKSYRLQNNAYFSHTASNIRNIYQKVLGKAFSTKKKEELKEYLNGMKKKYIDIFDQEDERYIRRVLMSTHNSFMKEMSKRQ